MHVAPDGLAVVCDVAPMRDAPPGNGATEKSMRRYHGIEIQGPSGDPADELPLGEFYLVHVSHVTKGWERYRLQTQPPCKNLSGEECPDGWCGTNNDVSVHGRGAVRVAKDARGRVRIRPIPLADLTESEEISEPSELHCQTCGHEYPADKHCPTAITVCEHCPVRS